MKIPQRPAHVESYGAQDAELAHYKAVAIRAVKALREIAKLGSYEHGIAVPTARVILREIDLSGWQE